MAVRTPNRSRTPLPDRTNPGAIVRATVDKLPTCACGQALDTCHVRRLGVPETAQVLAATSTGAMR